MLSRHFRAHNLNVSEMRLLFLCDARIRESLSEVMRGGGGGGGPSAEKQPQQRFFKPSTDFTVIHGGSNIFQGGGFQHFQGGGGVQVLISIKTHITCDFLERVLTPCPPSGSARV